MAEKHFREGRQLNLEEPAADLKCSSGDTDDSSKSGTLKGDSPSFAGMSGAQDVVAARQVLDFFTGS